MKRLALLMLAAALAVAGCSSSGSSGNGGGGGAKLADSINTAVNALTSAHLEIDTGALGGKSSVEVMLKAGKVTASDAKVTQSNTPVEVVTVGETSYVKLPGDSAKPWVLVSPLSTNAIAKALATSPGVTDVLTSLSFVSGMARSADSVKDVGTDATGHHYTLRINSKKGTGNSRLDGMLSILGNTEIPTDVWLDAKNRPVKVQLRVPFGGGTFPVTIVASDFDAPLHITAPAPSEIGG